MITPTLLDGIIIPATCTTTTRVPTLQGSYTTGSRTSRSSHSRSISSKSLGRTSTCLNAKGTNNKIPRFKLPLPGGGNDDDDDDGKEKDSKFRDDTTTTSKQGRGSSSSLLQSFNFWSSSKSNEDDNNDNDDVTGTEKKDGGILGFIFNRQDGSNDDKESDDKDIDKKQRQRRQKKKSKKDKQEQDSDQDENSKETGGGFFKGITSRFGGRNSQQEQDGEQNKVEESKNPFNLPIDMRPTFISITREPQKPTVPINSKTRAIPKDIAALQDPQQQSKIKDNSSPPPLPPLPPLPPTTKVKRTNAQQEMSQTTTKQRQQDDERSGDSIASDNINKDNKERKEKDSPSILGRIQSIFSNNDSDNDNDSDNNSTKDGQPLRNVNKKSPTSVVQKFFANMWDSTSNRFTSSSLQWGSSSGSNNSRNRDEEWVPVFPKTRITPGEIVPVEVAGLDLIIVASKDAQNIYCMVNSCPHLGTPLEIGFLERRPIEPNRYDVKPARTATKNYNDKSTRTTTVSSSKTKIFGESDIAAMLANDGCEDCIVCPLHRTAFALESGEVRGEWCPYPPVIGKMMATVKNADSAAVFDVRTRGKNIEVRLNTPLVEATKATLKDGRRGAVGRDRKPPTKKSEE